MQTVNKPFRVTDRKTKAVVAAFETFDELDAYLKSLESKGYEVPNLDPLRPYTKSAKSE